MRSSSEAVLPSRDLPKSSRDDADDMVLFNLVKDKDVRILPRRKEAVTPSPSRRLEMSVGPSLFVSGKAAPFPTELPVTAPTSKTETGASSAVVKLLPELDGKLTGNAIRVPTPNVSLAILNLTLEKTVNEDEVREFLRNAALHSSLQRQIDFTSSPELVSSDLVGNRHACIVDGEAIITKDNRVVLYVWYDNEFGYACQVVRVAQKLAGIRYPLIPEDVIKMGF